MSASTSDASPEKAETGAEKSVDPPNAVNGSPPRDKASTPPLLKTPTANRIIGISYRNSPDIHFSPNIAEATRLIRNNKSEKDARFKMFETEEDGKQYYAANPVVAPTEAAADGYRSPHKTPKPAERTLFYKGITNGVKNPLVNLELVDMMDQNPACFIEFSIDVPTIIYAGMRFNAMHVCAKDGNIVIAREIMRRVQDPVYLATAYGTDKNIADTSRHLVDQFLNTPDKIQKHPPAIIAARHGHYEVAAFLTSFIQCDIDFNNIDNIKNPADLLALCCSKLSREDKRLRHRIYDTLRHPMNVYCITVYAEHDDLSMPFIAITTRFPRTKISSDDKMTLFQVNYCGTWGVPDVEGTIRISDRAAPFHPKVSSHPSVDVESYRVVTMMGPYSNRREACIAYRKIHCYTQSREGKEFRRDPFSMTEFLKRAVEKEAELDGVAVFDPDSSGIDSPSTAKDARKLDIGVEALVNSVSNLKTDDVDDGYAVDHEPWTKQSEIEFTENVSTDQFLTAPGTPDSNGSFHSSFG
uniref:Ankyrin repeat protein n=1 Tax=Panagrellus redivivus TaxID=6233 RepID=A0A7E4V395_PANRE